MFHVYGFESSEQTQKAQSSLQNGQGHWENTDRETGVQVICQQTSLLSRAISAWELFHFIYTVNNQIEHTCMATAPQTYKFEFIYNNQFNLSRKNLLNYFVARGPCFPLVNAINLFKKRFVWRQLHGGLTEVIYSSSHPPR